MSSVQTVVFADIVGSTALYETLGNERAATAVTELTHWICESIEARGGRVVKTLGDGVLGIFGQAAAAVAAMAVVMQSHHKAVAGRAPELRLDIRVGLASGELVEVDGDCYGDAVNVAARLCELAGPAEIWATAATVQGVPAESGARFIRLGLVEVRGKADRLMMYQVEWREDQEPDSLTMQAALQSTLSPLDAQAAQIQFSWLGAQRSFSSADAPVHVGRATHVQLCVSDPRVSRLHARIDWRNGGFVLTDLSSFGTWVRFDGSDTDVQLRRDKCLLHGTGRIALGVPFTAGSAPTIEFQVAGASVHLG